MLPPSAIRPGQLFEALVGVVLPGALLEKLEFLLERLQPALEVRALRVCLQVRPSELAA
jgi:hypothetical protein